MNPASTPQDESFRRIAQIQDQQSNALQQLIHQQQQGVLALTLPQPSMPIFNGNSIDYCDFIRSFEHLIELPAPVHDVTTSFNIPAVLSKNSCEAASR